MTSITLLLALQSLPSFDNPMILFSSNKPFIVRKANGKTIPVGGARGFRTAYFRAPQPGVEYREPIILDYGDSTVLSNPLTKGVYCRASYLIDAKNLTKWLAETTPPINYPTSPIGPAMSVTRNPNEIYLGTQLAEDWNLIPRRMLFTGKAARVWYLASDFRQLKPNLFLNCPKDVFRGAVVSLPLAKRKVESIGPFISVAVPEASLPKTSIPKDELPDVLTFLVTGKGKKRDLPNTSINVRVVDYSPTKTKAMNEIRKAMKSATEERDALKVSLLMALSRLIDASGSLHIDAIEYAIKKGYVDSDIQRAIDANKKQAKKK